jgi:death-on-curing protein
MSHFQWLNRQALLLLHDESLAEHGGAPGMRDEELLDSALSRPLNLVAYGGTPDTAELAAAYSIGLAKNHLFVDSNKRAAFLALGLFAMLNGYRLKATQAEATLAMFAVAAGDMDEKSFAAWLREHLQERQG